LRRRVQEASRLTGWDGLSVENRWRVVKQYDRQRDPAFAEQEQRDFDLVREITELKRHEADLQRAHHDGLPSEITHRRDQMAKVREEIEAKELQLNQLVDGTIAAEAKQTTIIGSDAEVRAVINAIKAAGKQLKRSAFDKLVDELAKPPRGQKTKERERLWREIAPDAWRAEGQGSPGGEGNVIGEWERYLPEK
jgi:hypothetical protein